MKKTRLNLLSGPSSGESVPPRPFGSSPLLAVFIVILLGFEMAFLVTFYRNLTHQMEAAKKYQADLNQNIGAFQREIVKLKTQQESKIEEASLLGQRLKYDNQKLINILEVFSDRLPSKAWISHLSQQQNRFIIQGFALNNQIISDFMIGLQRSNHFAAVELIKAEQTLQQKRHLKKFAIACVVNKI